MARRKPVQHERTEQAHVIKLYRSIGATVYVLGTTRSRGSRCPHCHQFVPNTDHGTHQTPGISDLVVVLPPTHRASQRRAELLFHEVKARHGRMSTEQQTFRDLVLSTGTAHHVVGGLDAAIEFLVRAGRVRTESFPHYRTAALTDQQGATPCEE